MADIISDTFGDSYRRTYLNFDRFHDQIINMPRATFSEIPQLVRLLKSLASYILLIDRNILNEPMNCKQVYENIFHNYKLGIIPAKNRNIDFENTFLNINDSFDNVYDENKWKMGRRFRHYTELFSFFNIFRRIQRNGKWHKQLCEWDIDSLEELELTPESDLFDVFRNRLLNLNVKENSHIVICKGINLTDEIDYRPARAIIRYINELDREATDFEIAILLGRIDEVQKENEILVRANTIGKQLPYDLATQRTTIFDSMLWKNNGGIRFEYKNSQEPDFKFKTFIIMMETFGLLTYDHQTHYISLTQYSKDLIKAELPLDVLDLQNLLVKIENGTEDSNKLVEIILKKRTEAITKAIQDDGELVEKLNIRNIHYPTIKNGKRIRSRLIMEMAKIKANYLDEVTGQTTFIGKSGLNYVVPHHIIEFSRENGPDITDNLICLCSNNHDLVHHGSKEQLNNFYAECKKVGAITYARFETICKKYHCLTKEHVKALLKKGILTTKESNDLYALIDSVGVDPIFLQTLNIKATDSL